MASNTSDNGYNFGLKWSLIGCALALVYISACELIVPPDRSVPRYNSVNGEKRRPALNPGGANYQGGNSMQTRMAAVDAAYSDSRPLRGTSAVPAAPLPEAVAETEDPRFPPAPAMTAAERRNIAASQEQAEEGGFWSSLAFWRDDEKVTEVPLSQRHRPTENANAAGTVTAATAQPVASADLAPLPGSYPSLHSTPEKPGVATIDNSKQRALASRAELEAEQAAAMNTRNQVLKDAAAEPSLLANPPKLAEPVKQVPTSALPAPAIATLPPPPAMTHAQSAQVSRVMRDSGAVAAPAPAPVAFASVDATPRVATGGSAFERLTSRSLSNAAVPAPRTVSAPLAVPAAAPASSGTILPPPPLAARGPDALEPITLTPPPAFSAPEPATATAAPSPFSSVNVSPAPQVAGIDTPPMPASSPALEPIRLVPPGASMAGNQPGGMQGNTGVSSVQAATSQRYIHNQAYLPGSRYADRRR